MKIWMIVVVIGLLAVAGLAVANSVGNDEPVEQVAPSCDGGCSAGNTCSNAACGAKVGKSCGCRG